MASNALAGFFCNQAGRLPGHEYDDRRERKHVLVGARYFRNQGRQQNTAQDLQGSKQEAANDGAVHVAQPAQDGGRKTDHAKQKADAEVDLVVVQTVHDAGQRGQPRAQRKSEQHNGLEVDAHQARRLAVLCHRPDRQTQLGPRDHEMHPGNGGQTGDQKNQVVDPQVHAAELEGRRGQQRREALGIRAVGIEQTHRLADHRTQHQRGQQRIERRSLVQRKNEELGNGRAQHAGQSDREQHHAQQLKHRRSDAHRRHGDRCRQSSKCPDHQHVAM